MGSLVICLIITVVWRVDWSLIFHTFLLIRSEGGVMRGYLTITISLG